MASIQWQARKNQMPLEPGTTLVPYAVTAKIGKGGMGEVYRARDTKLDRDVALRVLPQAFTEDPDRLAPVGKLTRLFVVVVVLMCVLEQMSAATQARAEAQTTQSTNLYGDGWHSSILLPGQRACAVRTRRAARYCACPIARTGRGSGRSVRGRVSLA